MTRKAKNLNRWINIEKEIGEFNKNTSLKNACGSGEDHKWIVLAFKKKKERKVNYYLITLWHGKDGDISILFTKKV